MVFIRGRVTMIECEKKINENNVCFKCINDDFLKEYIKSNAGSNRCDYCKVMNHSCIAMPINEFIKEIIRCLKNRYVKGNAYADKGDPDYYSTLLVTKDIVDNEIKPVATQLSDDLCNLIGAGFWVDKYGNVNSPDEQDEIKWEIYSKKIKCNLSKKEKNKILNEALAPICQYIISSGLLETVDVGSRFYRARTNEPNITFISHMQLGPPPEDKVKYPNRFTKAGESAFYGSTDDVTPIIEVHDKAPYGITVSVFETTIPLTVINFYKFAKDCKQVRSLFEDDFYIKKFLEYFVINIVAPADEKDSTSYIPTQEAVQFFKKDLQEKYGILINGLIYPSSKNVRHTANCILFFNNFDCTDDEKNEQKPLKLLMKETVNYPPDYWTEALKEKQHITFSFNTNKIKPEL